MYKPTPLKQLSQDMRAAVRAEIPEADPWLWPNNLYVLSKVVAQALHSYYLTLGWVHRQARPLTAEAEILEGHGADVGIIRNIATLASGTVTISAAIGSIIARGARLDRSDGVVFKIDLADPTFATVIADTDFQVTAVEAGKTSNTETGTPLAFEAPVAGVTAVVVGADGLTGGAEVENDASLRARILARKRNPPHGGSPAEFTEWTMAVPGVTRVFVKRATPVPGAVTIMFMMDGYANGIPLPGDVFRVQTALDIAAPADADVRAVAPTPLVVDVEISGLDPDIGRVRDAIVKELLAMFQDRAQPATAAKSFTFSRSWISEAISMAGGENRHTLIEPVDDILCDGDGEIAVLGTVSFT